MAGVGAGAPFLRHEHLGLPCPKMLERAGTFALKGGPGLAETWAFSGPGLKVLVQAKSEWALASGHWPKSSSQAWVRKSIASVLFEASAPLPKTGGGNFSGDGEAEEEGKVPTLPSERAGATSSSLSFLASSSWEGSTVERRQGQGGGQCIPPIYPQDTCPTTPHFYQGPLSQFLTKQHHEAWSNPEELLCLFLVDPFFPHFC